MKIRSRWLTLLATWLAVRACRLLFATCRHVHHSLDPRLQFNSDVDDSDPERFICCLWHDSLLIPTFCATASNNRRTACLTSRHHDGSYIAELMRQIGIRAVRGSTNHGGAEAIRQMIDVVAECHLVITPDGPRGPRREMKAGPVFLASQTGRKICVAAFACRHAWRPSAKWTDLLVPKPFTTIHLLTSQPIAVPPNLSREELNQYVQRVQAALDELNAEAERLVQPAVDAGSSRRAAA